ncbi:unnamed protein product [Cylindrotheca closterium]|uniref:Uncharacterized protein n=1 Tax=Cylindrotheca closterium TaxID=2856 RepID=A0AAD2CEK0_9STRA|nr:unnamed protein product [Cylindrotheca closterium]
MAGRVVFVKCLKAKNMNAMVQELLDESDKAAYNEGKPVSITYTSIKALIANDVVRRWKEEHRDKPDEKELRKTFQPISDAEAVQKD